MELGSGSSESSTVEQVPRHDQTDQTVGIAFDDADDDDEGFDESSELELGLGLSLGLLGSSKNFIKNNNKNIKNNVENVDSKEIPRILTAKDLSCSSASSCSSLGLRIPSKNSTNSGVTANINSNNNNKNVSVGTKRAVSPTAVSQVVGWPPIRSYRMSSMANQPKSTSIDESKGKDNGVYGTEDKVNAASKDKLSPHKSSLFVKVNMDGVGIGRKVDLSAHSSYESLALTLEEMFDNRAEKSNSEELVLMPKVTRPSKLLDGTSDMVLTYEDKDGDWMLVGDVPWRMFVTSVKRLKIMRTSEANGLAPRFEDRSSKQKCRPI
ncbi:hypothetical protein RND81_05G215500 [Saponaria officinalis]|uniref:Auxin-responsive protein n=1 Tax=Saponaria officinalis TaxID=3572 RepID=A0AAW1L2X8_SAPOF